MAAHIRARLGADAGFSIIEVMVAAVVLGIGLIGLISSFDSSKNVTNTADMKTFALDLGQRELEKLQGLPFTSLTMASIPARSADVNDPTNNISTTTPRTFAWDPAVTNETRETLVEVGTDGTVATGGVAPLETVTRASAQAAGNQYGYTLWRFVTRVLDAGVACSTDTTKCPRRITVVVKPSGFRDQLRPIWQSSIVTRYTAGT